jgi:D-aspartate ligase
MNVGEASTAFATKELGAIVFGGDYQGLGIVRSLGRRKIPVVIVDDEFSIARYSRYSSRGVSVPELKKERTIVDCALEIGKRLGLQGWVLYPTRDEMVSAFSRFRPEVEKFFRVPTPEWESVKWIWDKRNTYELAGRLGIPTPKTWYPRDADDLEQITGSPPFAVKPAIKEHFFYATRAKAWRADSREALRVLVGRAAAQVGPGEVMVQDLIPGGGNQQFAYCAFFKEGKALGSMVVRRSRQHPPEFGRASTFVETIEMPLLEELSERFLRAINYYGLVELEYKLDPRDGQFRLLDVNGRTWGYHTLGLGAGVDFPYMLYADQIGLPVTPCRGRPGVSWIRLVTDLPTALRENFSSPANLRAYLGSVRSCHADAVFSWNDPVPGLVEIALLPYLFFKRGF